MTRISLLDFIDRTGARNHGHALDVAASRGMTIGKYADPTSREKEGLTVEEAKEVARADASLVWLRPSAEQITRVDAHILRLVTNALKSERSADIAWLSKHGGTHPVVGIIRAGRERGDSEEAIVRAIRAFDPKFAHPFYDSAPARALALNAGRDAENDEARELALLRLIDAQSATFDADVRAFLSLVGIGEIGSHIWRITTYRKASREEISGVAREHLSRVAPGLLAA